MITPRVRDLLIEHIDGPVPFHVRVQSNKDFGRPQIVRWCIARGLLRADIPGSKRPKFTVLADRGREELAIALADWAEALIRAQRTADAFLLHALENEAREAAAGPIPAICPVS